MTTGFTAFEEPGRYYTFSSRMAPGEYFEIRPQFLPHNAQPIVDDESGMCIGYTVHQAPGLWQDESDFYKIRFNKQLKKYEYKKYTLEVVVREKDWTVVHFMYFE